MKEKAKKAAQKERMIQIRVRFWTHDIVEGEGYILPKHARSRGRIELMTNHSHGIEGLKDKKISFESLMELPAKIEELLIREGITLHMSPKMQKYMQQDE